jgi:gliding motility-associated-like protein
MNIQGAFLLLLIFFSLQVNSQSVSLTPNQTATQLATRLIGKGILLPGSGMSLNCNTQANGNFINVNPTPNLSLAIDTGIVLCTGRVLTVSGDTGINANRLAQASKNWGITTTDAQITSIAGATAIQRDLCFLQFNFIPQGDTAFIDYAFASEEYPEYGCSQYVDAFGIFVAPPSSTTFTNYAKVPGTNVNVSTNSINDTMKQTGWTNYVNYCQSLGSGAPFIQHYTGNLVNNHIVYDGMTKTLRAIIPVSPFQTHTMKIAIADIADGFFDSGIFLKQFSFTSKIKLEITEKRGTNGVPVTDTVNLIEGCNPGVIRFSRAATTFPITVNASFSGTSSTSDYTAASSFTIPTGSSTFIYNIQAILDSLKETPESLRIVFSVPSINFSDTVLIMIRDFAHGINIFNGRRDTSICSSRTFPLSYSSTNAVYTMTWLPASRLSCTNCTNPIYTAPSVTLFTSDTVKLRIAAVGCPTADSPILVRVQPFPILSLNPSLAYCKGDSAQLQVTPNPASSNYTYAWSPATWLSSTTIPNPIAKPPSTQAYKVIVSTSAGCRDSANTQVKVSIVRDEIDSVIANNTSCGISNGSIRIKVKTGAIANPPYQYSVNGGVTFVTNHVFNGLAVGSYNIAIRNVSGCRWDTAITVTAGLAAPVANYKIDSTSCGLNNGQARILTKSGVKPVTQTWRLGSTIISTDTFIDNRPAGVYSLSIQDSLGCVVQYTISIGPSNPTSATPAIIQPSCGLTNGSITITPNAGIAPYRYLWNTGDTFSILSGRGAGTYIHTLTDAKGCIKKDTIVLNNSVGILVSRSFSSSNCGQPNGSATITVTSGGISPYTYTWSNGVSTSAISNTSHSISGLNKGWYRVTIQDGRGCVKIDSIFVDGTPQVALNFIKTNTNCGLANGAITADVVAGKSPFVYQWSGGSTTATRTNLTAGFYVVTVTDSNNCTVAASVTLTNNSLPIISASVVRPTCGLNNGRILTTVSGGKPKIKFQWSNGDSVSSMSKLAPGIYALTVTDSFGCQAIRRDTLVAIPMVNFTDSVVQPFCRNSFGSIFLKNITGPAPITIMWANGSSNTSLLNRPAGIYSVMLRDTNNCRVTRSFNLQPKSNPQIKFAITNAMCLDTVGSIITTVDSAMLPIVYSWSSGDTSKNISNKLKGFYTLIITDSFGCKDTLSDSIRRRPSPTYSDSFKPARCALLNGMIHIYNVKGSGPFNYLWTYSDTPKTGLVRLLPMGVYTVAVTDANGCQVLDTFDLNSNGSIGVTYDMTRSKCRDSTGKIALNFYNGTPPYTITWSNGDKGPVADSLKHGTYGLFIRDSLGCTYIDSIKVKDSTDMRMTFDIVKTRCDDNTGKVITTPSGGFAKYKYHWDRFPGDTFAIIDTLEAKLYKLRAIDSLGCKYDTAVIIQYTHYPKIKDSVVLETCIGGNGEVHIKIDSVIQPVLIRWNGVKDSVYKKTGLTGVLSLNVFVMDSHKCNVTHGITLQENPTQFPRLGKVPPPCGRNLGTLEVLGDIVDSIIWSPGGKTTRKIDSLAPGPYEVTVSDTNGCTFVLRDTLEYTIPPITSYLKERPNCGKFDGEIIGSAISNVGGLEYAFKKVPGTFTPNIPYLGAIEMLNLDSGYYIVRVRDGLDCLTIDTIHLIDSSVQKVNLQAVNARCIDNNGKAKVNITGGKLPYIIQWYDFTNNDSIVNLSSGIYAITVTDDRNCVVEDSAEVKFFLPPELSLQGENSLCGNGKGKITTTVGFGVKPFTYQWQSSSVTTKDRVNLNGGSYALTVTDTLGCWDTASVFILAQPALITSLTRSAAHCALNNGMATATIVSGKPPYNIAWNGSWAGLNLVGIDSGRHVFHVIDSNNCERRDTIYVPRVPKTSISTTITNDNCTYKIGTIQSSASGGRLPYTYAWSHNASLNASSASNLGAGNYTVSVTDSLGCQVSELRTISDSAGPMLSMVVTNASCGLNNASIQANVSSNKPPIIYYWNNIIGTNNISNINGGRYICRVVDARGCIKTDTVTVDTSKALFGTFNKKNASCNINNGYVKVNMTGGTGTRIYSWAHTFVNTDSIRNLSPGTYKLTVSDAKGCRWSDSITITQQGFPSVSLTKYDAKCRLPNGRIKVTVSNQASPMSFIWSNTQTTDSVFNLVPSSYTVTASDGYGCNVAANIQLGNVGMDSIRFQIFHPRCLVNNGRVKAIAVNALGNVNYSWSTTATVDSIHPLAQGTYSVTISDSMCTHTKSANLVMGTKPKLNLIKQDASCGINNGTITTNISMGTPPMTFKWSNNMTPANLFGVDSGNYRVVVTDDYGCKDSNSIYVGRIAGLNMSFNTIKSKCGLANGSIQASVSGGAPGYDFTWNTGDKTATISNIVAGKYWLTARDLNNCVRTDTVNIEDRKKPMIKESRIAAVCQKANGEIRISIEDGTKPFTYLWSTGDTTKDIDSLAIGIYRLTVTDSLGCIDSKSIDIDPGTPPYLHPDSTRSEQSTCGLKNGKLQALLMRGVDPITYTWSTGDTGRRVEKIIPGKHYLTVVDGRQCVSVDSLVVSTTTIPKIKLDSTDAYCLRPTGQITTSITDGSSPFKYKWSHGATTQNAVNVASGTYTLIVSDTFNCADTATTRVMEEKNLVTSTYDTFRLRCYDDNSGRVIFHAQGGQSPYQYAILTSSADSIFNGLSAGKFYFAVTDAKGCVYRDSFLITQPDSIRLVFDSIKPLTCHNRNDGMLQVTASGSNGGFSYQWLPSSQTTNKAINLGDDVHTVTATDSKGCFKNLSHTFINPEEIKVTSQIKNNLCFGESKGAISLEVSNGIKPYTYAWSNGSKTSNPGQLSAAVYTLTLTDKVGCVIVREDTVTSPRKIIPGDPNPIDQACNEQMFGELDVKNTDGGVKPYLFSIDQGLNFALRNKFTELKPGKYQILIKDNNGCLDTIQTEIKGFPPFGIYAFPKDTTVAVGESVPLGFDVIEGNSNLINSIRWYESDGLSCTDCREPWTSTYVSKRYTVEVKYNSRCVVYDTVKIKVIDSNDLYIPNSFAPDASNPENRTFRVYANKVMRAELMIFNRWGEKMFETDDGHLQGWDGIYKGEPAPMAVYIYHVRVTYFGGRKVERKGDVTLVR